MNETEPAQRRSGAGDAEHGPRWVEVDPERLSGWIERFGDRHGGPPRPVLAQGVLTLTAPDGAEAQLHRPPGVASPRTVSDLVVSVAAARRIGLLLARRGGYAVGVAVGEELVSSKVDSRYVQGRTAAGGRSQHRFARRRDNQAKASAGEAADLAVRLLLPEVSERGSGGVVHGSGGVVRGAAGLAAVVTGGDRRTVDAVLADPRLTPLRPLVAERFLAVPDPKLAVLQAAVRSARAVWVRVTDPPPRREP